MKKLLLIFLLLFFAVSAFCQKCFIGQSRKQVRAFYEKIVSPVDIDEGTFSDSTKTHFLMIIQENEMFPVFTAKFDKSGHCNYHELNGGHAQLARWLLVINKNKALKYNKAKDGWIETSKNAFWKIKQQMGDDNFTLTCSKLK